MRSEVLRDAIGYWEPRRLWYNVALAALTVTCVLATWPHFRPAFTLSSLCKLIVLAALANVCYSAAYLIDVAMQRSSFRAAWQRRRWVLWLVGTLLALAFTFYWIADEIYPHVGCD
ncbi:MAG TPA: hypothetical protein VMT45_13910 [Thermoanaerobaculaceae bacterium]|nr:hypothetical protein [Thermoanaerobaculaceae bacterium]